MNKWVLALGLVVLAAFLIGRWVSTGEETPAASEEPVQALRYRIVWADSALDLSHGGGRWVDELYFPASNLTATLVYETQASTGDPVEFATRPRIYVNHADKPRTDLTGISDEPPQPAVDVQVPAAFARAVAAYAAMDAQGRTESARLGAEFASVVGGSAQPLNATALERPPGDAPGPQGE